MNQKQLFVVLGMSRSGTSATAKALNALGIDLGDRLLAPDERNPKGFYEDEDILYGINRGVSALINHEWLETQDADSLIEQDARLRSFKNYAVGMLCERLMSSPHWGFKDPRTVTLLPFWQNVFRTLNVDERYVLVFRNPLAVAYSGQKFNHVDLEMELLSWAKILVAMIEGTHHKDRVLVNYESLLALPRLQLERMYRDLKVTLPWNEATVKDYAEKFLDKNLRHHAVTDDELRMHPALSVAPICIKLYDFAMKLARDEIKFNDHEFKSAWLELKDEFLMLQPLHAYIEKLHRRCHDLERNVRTIKKSIPYKVMYPLHKIDDFLRARRKKQRELNRIPQ